MTFLFVVTVLNCRKMMFKLPSMPKISAYIVLEQTEHGKNGKGLT